MWVGAKALSTCWSDWVRLEYFEDTDGKAIINTWPEFPSYVSQNHRDNQSVLIYIRNAYGGHGNNWKFADWSYTANICMFVCEFPL